MAWRIFQQRRHNSLHPVVSIDKGNKGIQSLDGIPENPADGGALV